MQFSTWDIVSMSISVVIGALMFYQIIYIIIGLFAKITYPEAKEDHTYGIIICARNEEKVIGQLIDSIHKQLYPQEKLRIFVIADNCDEDDKTAEIARSLGCDVFERQDPSHVGKSFALDFLFHGITEKFPDYNPDAWIVFDADNLLDPHYIAEMNKCFDAGNKIITSYRDSKNFGASVWSMGAAVHFIRECRFVHAARSKLNVSTHVSGTGFLVASDVLNIKNGWKYRRMTEDCEFSVDQIIHGQHIAYCDSAVFYDEQPTTYAQTFRQRMRWQKGGYQLMGGYTGPLLKQLFKTGKFALYDMLIYFTTAIFVSIWAIACFVTNSAMAGIHAAANGGAAVAIAVCSSVVGGLMGYFLGLFVYGSLAVIRDWKRIRAPGNKKLAAIFAYPLFMVCLIPIVFLALFAKATWKPIHHEDSITIDELSAMGDPALREEHAETH